MNVVMAFGAATSDENKAKEAPFNFAMLYYMGLNKLLEYKDQIAASGDLYGWLAALKAVRRRIRFKLNVNERKSVENKIVNVEKSLRYEGAGNERLDAEASFIIGRTVAPLLDDLDMYLWDLMDRYKMIFPNIEAKGGLKHVLKRYNLDSKKDEGDE